MAVEYPQKNQSEYRQNGKSSQTEGTVDLRLNLCKDFVRRKHCPVRVRAVYSDEMRICPTLSQIHAPHGLLELYAGLMDVVASLQIIPVPTAT